MVAFGGLQLRTCCLYLRALFSLNLLALLHERLRESGGSVALLLEVSRKIRPDPRCGLLYGLLSKQAGYGCACRMCQQFLLRSSGGLVSGLA